MGLLPEMMHPVRDGLRLVKDEPAVPARGEGFVWFAERLLKEGPLDPSAVQTATRLIATAAELGAPRAYVWLGHLAETGVGTERNLKLALQAYTQAILGDSEAGCRATLRVLEEVRGPPH